jgi:hypothetical protein
VDNISLGITLIRGGTLKFVNMQQANAYPPMLSMPSWRQIVHRREEQNPELQILLSEVGMFSYGMVAPPEGKIPNFHEAFTQLHLGQPLASFKCISRNRRDGRIDPNAYDIVRNFSSSNPGADEDLRIGGVASHSKP